MDDTNQVEIVFYESPVTIGREIFESAHASAAGIILANLRVTSAGVDTGFIAEFNRLMNWHKEVMWSALHNDDFLHANSKPMRHERE